MSGFDDLTLGEVDEIQTTCLGGKQFSDADANPLMLAGGVMWMMKRRDDPALDWNAFKHQTRMAEIKAYSEEMQAAEQVDPTNAPSS
jgi:hypothetical protein